MRYNAPVELLSEMLFLACASLLLAKVSRTVCCDWGSTFFKRFAISLANSRMWVCIPNKLVQIMH